MRTSLALFTVLFVAPVIADPPEFLETLALAPDRDAALKELTPGTDDYYFYSALNAQVQGRRAEYQRLMAEWSARFPAPERTPETGRHGLLETRQMLIDYSTDPAGSLARLKEKLELKFDHQRESAEGRAELKSALDETAVSRAAFLTAAMADADTLDGLTDEGLLSLLDLKIEWTMGRIRSLLSRLKRPDFPGLAEIVLKELEARDSKGFGAFPIHAQMTLAQLEQLRKQRPDLANRAHFVHAWMTKLAPPAGTDADLDPVVRGEWLARLDEFTAGLTASFNSLRAHVLYHRLRYDWQRGAIDPARLIAYLKLPRPVRYLNPRYRERRELWEHEVAMDFDARELTGGGAIGDDEPLIRAILLRRLAEAAGVEAFAAYLSRDWLNRVQAEAMLTSGAADPARWTSMLRPSEWQALKDRVDVEFDPACRESWKPGEEVALDLWLKNVPQLIVKIYEINTESVYRATGREVDTSLNLDGLIPNKEEVQAGTGPSVLRRKHTIKLPALNDRRGVWIVDFIGGGKSSRALIRKGSLRPLVRPTGAGTLVTVLDEALRPIPKAWAQIGPKRFTADQRGAILIPFSAQPGVQKVVLGDGEGFASLEDIMIAGENYSLAAGFHVPRESLLPGTTATVAIRPVLLVNDRPAPLEALEKVTLTITSTTHEGTPASATYHDLQLVAGREALIDFQVPARLSRLHFLLKAHAKSLAMGVSVMVEASHDLKVNGISSTEHVSDLYLSRSGAEWLVHDLGRNGEPRAGREITVGVTRPEFHSVIEQLLKTDAAGAVHLGTLSGVASIKAQSAGGIVREWTLPINAVSTPAVIHAKSGEPVLMAWPWPEAPTPANASLMERRGGTIVRDAFHGAVVKDGILEIPGLTPGEYSLTIHRRGHETLLRITDGALVDGHALTASRSLELSNPAPLAITGMKESADQQTLVFHVSHATPGTRVHVFASRFLPEFDAAADLGADIMPEPAAGTPVWRRCVYQSARDLGDEYRYVLERRSAKSFPGNMLPRPGLLLNPWAIADTKTQTQAAGQGGPAQEIDAGRPAAADPAAPVPDGTTPAESDAAASDEERIESDLSFLASAGPAAFNLKPDAAGRVVIQRKSLGDRHYLRVLAVHGDSSAMRDFALSAPALRTQELRLARSLDGTAHFSRQNRVTLLERDAAFQFKDALTATFETIGSLGSAHQLFFNLTGDKTLQEFSWMLEWPSFDDAKKRELYSKYACHEVHFFLARKDPDFFKTVVLPSLANKRDRTFMDHYLLGADLTRYLRPWAFSRLNTLERILLSQRIEPERDAVRRHIREWLATVPPDPQRDQRLFETALFGKALISDKSGIELADAHGHEHSFPVTPTTPWTLARTPGALSDTPFDPPQIPQTFGGGGLPPADPFASPSDQSSIAGLGIIKRQERIGQALGLESGADELFARKDYEGAITKYRQSLALLPAGSINAADRERIVAKFARGAVLFADELGHRGEFLKAKSLLNYVLSKEIDPNYAGARQLLERFDDPDRYNPAMSPRHANAGDVNRLFRLGLGYYDLGDFRQAEEMFNRILAIDPTNTAARRQMEKVEREISNYLLAARDHTRLKMVKDVDNLWVTPVPGMAKTPLTTADFDTDAPAQDAWKYDAERDRHGTTMAGEIEYRKRALQSRADAFFRQLPKTQVWAEQNYYRLPIANHTEELVEMNRFWQDYAEWDGKRPFVSTHVAEAAGTLTEMLLALAVLDLPFPSETMPGKVERKENVLTFTPAGRTILFHQEIRASEPDGNDQSLLVRRNFYRHDDRWIEEAGRKSEKFVSGEFLTGVVYGCQVVLTNSASSEQSLEILIQIPAGSIPLLKTRPTQVLPVVLKPFHTQTLDYHFYFPAEGKFADYPAHVARNGKTVGFTAAAEFNVVTKPARGDAASWDYVSQHGTGAEVLAFLERHNLYLLDLDRTAWRLKDAGFFRDVVAHLRRRHVFHPLTWSYALYHNVPEPIGEYLEQRDDLIEECWKVLECPLLTIDPVERRTYEHLEFAPLINARAHSLGGERRILNDELRAQYHALLSMLVCRKTPTDEDRLALAYHLALQDRIDEAAGFFAGVDRAKVAEKLQYDYLHAWLAMCQDDLATARRIARERADVPVVHWRERFAALASQLGEIDGRPPALAKPEDRDAGQDQLASGEAALTFKVESGAVTLTYQNLGTVTANYYPMDLEFLFSSNPFVTQETSRFSAIRPHRSEEVALPKDKASHSFPLPVEFRNANVLIEITGGGQSMAVPLYASALDVQVSESAGRLEVRHAVNKKPVPKVYVKVFAQQNGVPVFYKDGYTDLRGKFDYASLSTGDLDGAQRFSILVLSKDFGAMVKELSPPVP